MKTRLGVLLLLSAASGCLDTADLGGGSTSDGEGGESSTSGVGEGSTTTGLESSEAGTDAPDETSTSTSAGESSTGTTGDDPPEGGLGPWGFGYLEIDVQARAIALEDFDGDGNLDIAAARRQDGMWVLQTVTGDGEGGFSLIGVTSVGGWDTLLRAADFNGDGNADVAAFDPYSANRFRIAFGLGTGAFEPAVQLDIEGFFGFGVLPMRYDDDDVADLFVPSGHSEANVVYRATGDGGFEEVATVASPGCYNSATGFGDLDGDGLDEVIATGSCNQVPQGLPVAVYRHGPEGFAITQQFIGVDGAVSEGGDVVVVDADGDGNLDVVTPTALGLYVLRGDGDGALEEPVVWPHSYGGEGEWPGSVRRVVPATRDDDGATMFVLAERDATGPAAIVEPAGPGVLDATPIDLQGRVLDAGDFDGDGAPDVVVLTGEENEGVLQGGVAVWLSGG
jgi:hypothetical protein